MPSLTIQGKGSSLCAWALLLLLLLLLTLLMLLLPSLLLLLLLMCGVYEQKEVDWRAAEPQLASAVPRLQHTRHPSPPPTCS